MSAKVKQISIAVPYQEESVRIPAAVTLAVLVLIAVPLIMWILEINSEGTRSADAARFNNLIAAVDTDVRTVRALLSSDAEELAAIREARDSAVVTLIVPELVIVEEQTGGRPDAPFSVNLDGIYWSAHNPLASIDGETYRVGDIIQGHEIVYIGKTKVRFRDRGGVLVVKDMYEDLLGNQR